MKRTLLAIVCGYAFAAPASALQPQAIERSGSGCPSGYSVSGNYCNPRSGAGYAIHRIGGGCPSGYSVSGKYCVARSNAGHAMPRSGAGCPSGYLDKINIDGLEMSWMDIRQKILDAHKPIQHLFFKGIGNKLQYKDSCIAESVMLQFVRQNQVALPIHDSFIMRAGFAGDLEEAMRRAFYDEFQSDIPIKHEVIIERVALFNADGDPRTEEVTKDDREHSQWYDRNTMWLVSRGK